MSTFDAVRNRKRGEEAKKRVLDRLSNPKQEEDQKSTFAAVRNRNLDATPTEDVKSKVLLDTTLKSVGVRRSEPKQTTVPTTATTNGVDFKAEQSKKQQTLIQSKLLAPAALNTPQPTINNALQGKVPAANLLQQTGRGPANASQIPGISEYENRKKDISASNAPDAVKAYSNAVNYLAFGNPVGQAISNSFAGNSGVTRRDSTGNALVDKASDVINNMVTPFITPTGAPLGQGIIGSTYDATGQALASRGGQALLRGAEKVIPGSKDVVRVAATEGISGGLQGVGFGLQQGQDSGSEIGRNAALGIASGGILGGLGQAGGEVLARILRHNNVPEAEITRILALPEGRGTARQSAAEARSKLSPGTEPIITPSDFTPEPPVSTVQRAAPQEPVPNQPLSREQEIFNKGSNLTQEDIDYILSGQFDQTKLSPEVSSISRQEPTVPREATPLAEAAPEVNAQPQSQDMFTDLFGNQGLGITSGGSSARVGTGPIDTADQIVSRGIKNDRQGIKQSIAAQTRATYQNLVDNLDPLKRISQDTYESAMDATRANNLANTVVRDKFVNLEGEVIGSSLNDIFKKVARGQDKNFIDYLTLRHARTRMARGERVYAENLNMTPEKVQQRIDTLNHRYPGFEEIAQEWDKFNDNVLREIGVKEGLISNDLYNALREKNPNYSPMRRQFLRSEKPGRSFIQKSTKSSFSGQKAPIQQVSPTGSVRNIVDPRKSTIESVGAWTNAALRNRTMQSMVDAIKRDPEAFKGVAEIVQQPKSKVNLKEVLTDGGQDDFLEALDADFKDLFSTSKVDGDNVVRAMVNGEPVYIKVQDPEIVKTLIGMGPQASNILIDTMAVFSNATKRGATGLLAPAFAIKGATMDLAQSAIQSKNPPKQLAYTVYSILSGIGDSLNIPGLRNWAQEYRRAGGGYTAALKGDRALNKSISDMTRDPLLSPKGLAKGATKAVTAPFKILEEIGNIAENAPRIAAAKMERQSLGNQITPENIRNVMSAGREATVNFSRKGALTRDIESFIPYNNAAVQGTYRVLRAFKKNPVRTVAAIGALAVLPKLYEYSKFADDPDYQKLPARERMRFLIVNKNADGTFTKIPMEPAYNSFGEATIEALRYFKDNDPTAFKGTMDALANAWTPPLLTGALQGATKGGGAEASIAGVVNSTVAAPFVASVANQSFTGAPIVSQALQDRSRPYQYDERTSSVAKTLGQTLDMSPQKVDYIIRSYGGDLARLVLPLTSDLGQGNVRNTLLKNFIVDPEFSNTLTDDFYDAKEKLNQAYADYNEAGVELPSWYDDSLRKALNSTAKGSISKQLSSLRDSKKQITADKSLTDKQRTEQLREVQQQINEIYIDINSVLQESGVIK